MPKATTVMPMATRPQSLEISVFPCDPSVKLYGHTKAVEFGPRGLKTVRQKMIDMGWCRNNINQIHQPT